MRNSAIKLLLPVIFLLSNFSIQAQQSNKYSKQNITEEFLNITLKEHIYKKLQNDPNLSESELHKLGHYYLDNYPTYKTLFSNAAKNVSEETKQAFEVIVNQVINQVLLDFQNYTPALTTQKTHDHSSTPTSSQKKGDQNDKGPGDPCNNADFETCDFTGWDLFDGSVNNNPYQMVNITPSTPGGNHTITTTGTDPLVPIPTTDPNGGGCSVMLGDYTGTGNGAASMRQTFLVSPQTTSFTYSYALVLEDPSGHTVGEKPFFKVNMYDQNNNPITCGEYEVISGPVNSGGDPDFLPYAGGFYLPWRTTFAPLNAYIGQNVTIEFIIGDCSQGGHYGYGYIDANCAPLEIIESDTVVCGGGPVTLTAPAGATSYLWSPGGQTTQSITTATPGNYSVVVTPVSGSGCSVTLTTTIYGSTDYPISDFTASPINICVGESVTFTDQSYVVGTSTISDWAWDFDGDGLVDDTTQTPPPYVYSTPGTYTAELRVWTNGCSDTSTVTINVNAGPTAGFSFNNVCYGSLMNFTDTSNANGGVISNWSWDFQNNGTVDNTNQNPAHGYPTAGSYDVELLVETSGGCKDSIVQTIYINPLPVANFSAASVCLTETTIFIDSSTISSGTIDNWSWDFDDGAGTSTAQSPTYTYANPGLYNVSLTVASDSGCSNTIIIPVNVYASPTAAFATSDVCLNTLANFNSSTSNGNGGTINQWNWDFDFNGITHTTDDTTQNPSYNYTNPGTYTIQLIITTNAGCADTTTETITIFPSPVADFTFNDECFGTAINFTDNSNVSSGNITNWNWDFDNGNNSATQNPSELYVNDGDYDVTLIVTSDNGCTDTVTKNINVWPLPVVDFSPTNVCLNNFTRFIDQSNISSGSNVGWNWDFDDNSGSTIQSPIHTYTSEGVYQVQLIVTTDKGCIDSVTKPVTVHPLPEIDFSADITEGCTPVIVNFTSSNSTIASGSIVSWFWNFGSAGTSNQENPTNISFTNPSHATVATFGVSLTATSDKGCVSKDSVINMITSYPKPLASFTYDPIDTDIYSSEITFTDNSIIPSQWLWELGDGATSMVQNPIHEYADSGLYYVTLFIENVYGCKDTTQKPLKIKPTFAIWIPNAFTPDGDNTNDYFTIKGYGIIQLETLIFDRWGEIVFNSIELEPKWNGVYKGKLVKTDVYVYKVKARDIFGEWHDFTGRVSVIK
ncbi:MAG: PKD domain-containing protein [Flavobacteriales bacterium]|nr:PKD domain-containing protein [Flavobacteriales bacterium]